MTRRRAALACLASALVVTGARAAPPSAALHQLEWLVHVDLIDADGGRDLAFYEAMIDQTMLEASLLLEGNQGPADTPCCTRLERAVSVATFGSSDDGLDVVDSQGDLAAIGALSLPGSQAFLVDSMTFCGGPAPASVGCAPAPPCDGNPNDDPNLWFIITLEAFDDNNAVQTLAHERGHNACLVHVDDEECQLMRSGSGGGCLDATECTNYRAARNATGGSCACHDDTVGSILADGSACSEIAQGLCSGGVCGDPAGPGSAWLVAAAGPGFGEGEDTDIALRISGLTGGWSELGVFGMSGEVVEGLAYATDSGILYGVVPSGDEDSLVTIDPGTGVITATVGTLSNGDKELIALAYDPGATSAPGDDLLLALETDGTFEDLVTIDPEAPNTATFVGALASGAANGFRGLAYDSAEEKLYTSSPFPDGIYEIDRSTCPFFCGLVRQDGLGLVRFDSGLAYSADTGMLHLVGSQLGLAPLGPRTLYDVVDPTTFVTTAATIQVDPFTTGGLAALPNTLTTSCGDGNVEGNEQCDGGPCCKTDGSCEFSDSGETCGDGATACSAQDTCDGAGVCAPNHLADTTGCGDAGDECTNADFCDGSGACTDNGFVVVDTACGNGSSSTCDGADSCDGSGTCLDNFAADSVECRPDSGSGCDVAEACDGAGACPVDGFALAGTVCADLGDQCAIPDTCDFSGTCIDAGFAPDGSVCSDDDPLTLGDECNAGACEGSVATPVPAGSLPLRVVLLILLIGSGIVLFPIRPTRRSVRR